MTKRPLGLNGQDVFLSPGTKLAALMVFATPENENVQFAMFPRIAGQFKTDSLDIWLRMREV